MKTVLLLNQVLILIIIAPFYAGLIKKVKNNIRMRQGASLFQPYYNLSKLFSKDEVISETTSWIFNAAPYIVLGSTITAAMLLPTILPGITLKIMGDFIIVMFLLALGRFFLSLAGLDAGSSFGGMGSSRDMFISSFVEPVMILAIFAVGINSNSTNLNIIAYSQNAKFSTMIAAIVFFIITIVETSSLPVDNKETHLELTMVHEAMTLEYSGRSLAMLELASYIKQLIFFSIISMVIMPQEIFHVHNVFMPLIRIGEYICKLSGIAIIFAFFELMVAKMRLFRVPDFLAFAFVLSAVAVIMSSLGF